MQICNDPYRCSKIFCTDFHELFSSDFHELFSTEFHELFSGASAEKTYCFLGFLKTVFTSSSFSTNPGICIRICTNSQRVISMGMKLHIRHKNGEIIPVMGQKKNSDKVYDLHNLQLRSYFHIILVIISR